MLVRTRHPDRIIYPESDGKPMGENTLQVKWIIALFNGLDGAFGDRLDVFFAADLFWYPVEGDPKTVTAPEVMVVFGRPKGDRPSYKQWEEANIPPQVVFEIQSPGNTALELKEKREFYRRYGVEEYYLYNPESCTLQIWARTGRRLAAVKPVDGYVSPRLGLRFEVPGSEPMRLTHSDGTPFQDYGELKAANEKVRRQIAEARREAAIAKRHAAKATKRAESLAAKLRALGLDPDAV